MSQITSGIIYRGPSLLTGEPIVVVFTTASRNPKTGAMLQTWILRDGIDPRVASQSGQDTAICGHCPLKGDAITSPNSFTAINPKFDKKRGKHYIGIPLAKERPCYVNIGVTVMPIYNGLQRGIYPTLTDAQIREAGAGKVVRLGAYGDPVMVPGEVWDNLIADASGFTGYSHQWRQEGADFRPEQTMASADSLEYAKLAWDAGYRTFRVVNSVHDLQDNEILCPASKEGGYKTTCANCQLCAGTTCKSPKSVAIVVHGHGSKYFDSNNIIAKG